MYKILFGAQWIDHSRHTLYPHGADIVVCGTCMQIASEEERRYPQHNWGTARVHCGWNGEIAWSQGLINKTMLILSSLPQKMSFGEWKGKVQSEEHICNMFFQWKDCCPMCVCKLEKETVTYFSVFCLGNPMGKEPGGFAKRLTWLSDQTTMYI